MARKFPLNQKFVIKVLVTDIPDPYLTYAFLHGGDIDKGFGFTQSPEKATHFANAKSDCAQEMLKLISRYSNYKPRIVPLRIHGD